MIHKYKMHGAYILVDTNSGAVHEIDELAYELLADFQTREEFEQGYEDVQKSLSDKYSSTDISETVSELKALIENDMLFSNDDFSDYVPFTEGEPILKSLCLHICHDCNLRCKYCFAGTGDFGGERLMMSAEVGKKAIDLLIEKSKHRRNLEVDFFGGEPLMNFDVVKEIVSYARSLESKYNKKFRFTITTNGVLINQDVIDYVNENMHNVVLSIDGRKETNDRMRYRVDGSGSYDTIMPKFKALVDARDGKNYYVRGTFTHNNLDFSRDVLHLADEGFKQISVEPVVAGNGSGYEILESDLPQLFEEYEKLALEYSKRSKTDDWFNFFHYMIDLNQGPCIAKRLTGCGAGHEYAAITPDGDIFPCHQFVGQDEFKIGNVFTGIKNEEIRTRFKSCNVYTKEECKECWAKFYCSGGCAANAWQFNQDLNSAYHVGCELERKRVEAALWLKTQS